MFAGRMKVNYGIFFHMVYLDISRINKDTGEKERKYRKKDKEREMRQIKRKKEKKLFAGRMKVNYGIFFYRVYLDISRINKDTGCRGGICKM